MLRVQDEPKNIPELAVIRKQHGEKIEKDFELATKEEEHSPPGFMSLRRRQIHVSKYQPDGWNDGDNQAFKDIPF